MGRPRALLGGLAVVAVVACQPNATGGGGGGMANSLGGPMSDAGTDDLTGMPPDGTGSTGADAGGTGMMPPADGTTTDGPPPGDTGSGGAMLSISDGPTYDFGDVGLGMERAHPFTVTNDGDAAATGLAGSALAPPFSFVGGSFPGTGGDCAGSLAAGASCTVEVAFVPTGFGPFDDALTVTHDGGDATRPVAGGGIGETANLLENPGGEIDGTPPPSWANVGAGGWEAGPNPWISPHAGTGVLWSYQGPTGPEFWLVQAVDVAPWATVIDQGVLRSIFQGFMRSYDWNNDHHRMRVVFMNAGGSELDAWDTGWQGTPMWTSYGDMRAMPVGTRSVVVGLACYKDFGTDCDALFDSLVLRAAYP